MKKRNNKKGFSLIECIVALLLFSLITGAVIGIFASSTSQIKQQSDRYKTNIVADNIMAAFESSDADYGEGEENKITNIDFLSILDDELHIIDSDSISPDVDVQQVIPSGEVIETEGGEGNFSFDVNNVPVPISFKKIVVDNSTAIFYDNDDKEMVSFEGTYPNNRLVDSDDFAYSDCYTESAPRYYSGSMTLTGRLNLEGIGEVNYTYTINYDGSSVLSCDPQNNRYYSKRSGTKNSSEFDNYLLRNGYYLKCIYRKYEPSFGTTYDTFWFQVFHASDDPAINNTPVRRDDGKCLYYRIKVATNDDHGYYTNGLYVNMDNDTVKMFMYFNNIRKTGNKKGSIYYGYADEGTSYNKIAFNDYLYDETGKEFSGNWYYYPWLVANTNVDDGVPDISVSCSAAAPVIRSYEYTPKDAKIDFSYVLDSPDHDEMLVFNSEGDLIFPYKGSTTSALEKLKANPCQFGKGEKKERNARALYTVGTTEKLYDKWYKQGSTPCYRISKVEFNDNPGGIPEIVFYGRTKDDATPREYITFTYADRGQYERDRDSIIKFDGGYSNCYNFSKTYNAKSPLKASLTEYAGLDEIKSQLYEEKTEIPLIYFTAKRSGSRNNYTFTYEYYEYKITVNRSKTLSGYDEDHHTLKKERNGDTISCTEDYKAKATFTEDCKCTIDLIKHETITEKKKTGTDWHNYVPDKLKSLEPVDSFYEYNGLTALSGYKYDYRDSDWVKNNYINTNGIATGKTYPTKDIVFTTDCEVPSDSELNEKWTYAPEYDSPYLIYSGHADKDLYSLNKTDSGYEVIVGTTDDTHTTIFTANTGDYKMPSLESGTYVTDAACIYDVSGGTESVDANVLYVTYYITHTEGDISLVAAVTYSNYTKTLDTGGNDPKITIWTMPTSVFNELSTSENGVKSIVGNDDYAQYQYRTYRKG